MAELVLSLFPGIGLLDMAFEEQGFCVVRGPDLLWGGDIKQFHPPAGRFDGVIGGPPCQCHSRLVHINRARGHQVAEDLIPEFVRCIGEARPEWFLMENVPDAPVPMADGYHVHTFLLNNRWVGGEQLRLRRFVFGSRGRLVDLTQLIDVCVFEALEITKAVLASGALPPGVGRSNLHLKNGPSWNTVRDALVAQELPSDFLQKGNSVFTAKGAQRMIGNGVPLPMGRAVAKAVKEALANERISP
jgi:DNA (cytosine-5)-methyltransferase 1